MIGAAFDDRGAAHAVSLLKRLFVAADAAPLFVGSRALCAIGCSDTPLARSARRAVVDSVVFGAVEVPPFEHISDQVILRAPCSMVAASDGALLLARGPYGGRPLYYSISHGGRRLLACSRLAPLLASLAAIPEINVERLAVILVAGYVADASATPYVSILRVQPCESLCFKGRDPIRRRNVPPTPPLLAGSPEDLARELVERLSSTVARSISAFPKVAVMAGGGLDSSGLLAIVRKLRRDSGVFAIDYGEPNRDRPHRRTLARYFKLSPELTRAADAAPLLPAGLVVDGAPFGWPAGQFEVALGIRARRSGFQALLTGMGGDDLFDGDLGIYARRTGLYGRCSAIWDASRLRVTWSSTPFSRIRYLVLRPWFEALAPRPVRGAWRRWRAQSWPWAGPKLREVREIVESLPDRSSSDWFPEFAVQGVMADVADNCGQFEAAAGLSRIDSYLQAEIVEFIASVPPRMMFHERRIRGFFRLAMKGLLPESVRLRSNKAWFDPAFVELYSLAQHNHGMAGLLRMEALADLGLVDLAGFRAAIAQAEAQQDVPAWLSLLLGHEAFVRAHSHLRLGGAQERLEEAAGV